MSEGRRGPGPAPRRFQWHHLRYYVSGWIERFTGVRVFEFRNYTIV